jgi:mannitol-1-phosphate 5-dehydrogenase
VDKTIKRFKNPSVIDEVVRVGRGPLRKLSANDRFFKPMLELYNRTMDSSHLQKVVALALKFNVPEDEESVKLQALILAKGKQAALAEVSGLLEDHPLIQSIIKL